MTADWLAARARVFFQMTPESELPEMDEVLRLLWQQARGLAQQTSSYNLV
jgi:hypothetical protein